MEAGQYPHAPHQYPVSALLRPPPPANVRVSRQQRLAVCVPYKASAVDDQSAKLYNHGEGPY